ncbi:hypothetical protein AYO49_04825 [Verrucomicrobiaceae bacterium SCGC AG-212-N21]|nr:hypothetical protein AYO49_04825 [Verrucomicrobiaceae bacterium SCGC AG-212-N21]
MILYVATWPVIEIKSRLKEVGKPGVFTLPILQKPPQWVKATYTPLHALRTSFGKDNVLAQYWGWWNERLVTRPLRERSAAFQQRMLEMRLQSEQRLRESQQRLLEIQQRIDENRRKTEQRALDLQQRLDRAKAEAQGVRTRHVATDP